LDNRPRQTANLSLNWRANAWLQSALSTHYTGEQSYESIKLPAYTRVDLTASAKLGRNLTLRAGVKNLTDVNLESKSKDFALYELGRNYFISAAYVF
jgi:outer membrane receptor for ferrienterochelin and colicins